MNLSEPLSINYQVVPGLYDRKRKELVLQASGNKEEFLLQRVCELMKVDPLDVKSKSRKRELVEPRQIVMYLIKQYTALSLKKIGKFIGDRDHSTVLYSIQVVDDLTCTDKKFRERLQKIEAAIGNPNLTL